MKEAVFALVVSAAALGILAEFCDCFGALEKLLRGGIGLCALALVVFPFAKAILHSSEFFPTYPDSADKAMVATANDHVLYAAKQTLAAELATAISARFGIADADMEISLLYGEDEGGAVTIEQATVLLHRREHTILCPKIEQYVEQTLLCRCDCRAEGGTA